MGAFSLLTLYALVRGATSASGRPWYGLSLLACACGMASKPVMVTAPLITLFYDRIFLASSWAQLWRKRSRFYLGLISTWAILAACVLGAPQDYGSTVGGHVPNVTPWRYAATQAGVILHYMRLAIWPHPLLLDYAWPFAAGIRDALAPSCAIGGLLGLTAWALHRQPPLGFLGMWFFCILAPTSSLLPIADPLFEHRMYLPLAAVVVLGVVGGAEILRRAISSPPGRRIAAVGITVGVAVVLSFVTIRRNAAYAQVIPLWNEIVKRQPGNVRAHGNLGYTYETMGRLPEAIAEYQAVLRLAPSDPTAHHNLGTALIKQGNLEEGVRHFTAAVQLASRVCRGALPPRVSTHHAGADE